MSRLVGGVILIIISLVSCRKDPVSEMPYDIRTLYVGTWEFEQVSTSDTWIYTLDSTGNTITVHDHSQSVDWQSTGTISAGPGWREITVQYSDQHTPLILEFDSGGNLFCVQGCNDVDPFGQTTYGCNPSRYINDNNYRFFTSGSCLPSSVHTTYVNGTKQ